MAVCDLTLVPAAQCLACLTNNQLLAIIACQVATANDMSCNPRELMAQAQCLTCLTDNQLLAIIACNGAGGGGGGGGTCPDTIYRAAPSDPEPPPSPSDNPPVPNINCPVRLVFLNAAPIIYWLIPAVHPPSGAWSNVV